MNTKKGLIGVIVPVYKVEKYIAECIESILAQTCTNFRLILVDDGTPDNAGKICDEYAKKDARITVIHQENAGVTRARARGVEEANDCEFIAFVDGDDVLAKTALEKLHEQMNDDTDIVISTAYHSDMETPLLTSFWTNENTTMPIEEYRKKILSLKIGCMPWGKLFRRRIMSDFTFETPRNINYGEDAIMNLRIAFCTEKKTKTLKESLYFYRQHNASICNQFLYNAEYLEKLCCHLKESIPAKKMDKYMHSYIKCRIDLWRTLLNNRIKIDDWAEKNFHKELKQDIEKYNYKLPTFDRLLLKYSNPAIRFLIITVRKARNLLHR